MSERPAPVAVILVAYKSHADLQRCLPTLFGQGHPLDVVVVDNGPDDGTRAWLEARYPEVRYIANPDNSGYAGGNNLGLQQVSSPWVLILNPDTELQPGALDALLEAAETHPDALINAKLVQPDGSVNARGNEMHYTGITSCRDLGADPARFQGVAPISLLSGAAFLARREVLESLGGFDESFFMYLEDTDLSLRARLRGHRLLCADDAAIVHHYTLGMNPRKFYYLERNRLLALFRIFAGPTLVRLAPSLLLTELATWFFALMRGPAYLAARWRGYGWLWRRRRTWLAQRRVIQTTRTVTDDVLLADAPAGLPYDQLVSSRRLAQFLDRTTRPLFALLKPPVRGTA